MPKQNDKCPRAPTYFELVKLVDELRTEVHTLRGSTSNTTEAIDSPTNCRILSSLDQPVVQLTGREQNSEAEDWFGTIDGIARLNNWPTQYRLQYVRNNVTGAARSWFLSENFNSWEDCGEVPRCVRLNVEIDQSVASSQCPNART